MENLNQSNMKDSAQDAMDSLLDKLPKQLRSSVQNKLNEVIYYTPKIGVMGKSGAGKSSLINAILGNPLCQTGGVGGCTREFQEEKLTIGKRDIIFMDLPGVAENKARQKEYTKLYQEKLPELDLILWVIKADDRANIDDENFYNFLIKQYKKEQILFVLSQADKSEPSDEWDHVNEYKPSENQQKTINANRLRFSEDFHVSAKDVIPVACKYKENGFKRYNFDQLVERMIEQLPSKAKSSFYASADKKNRTKKAKETAKGDFGDVVSSIFDVAIDLAPIPTPIKTVARSAKNWIVKTVTGWWDSLFG